MMIANKWNQGAWIPTGGLLAWHAADQYNAADVYDQSVNGRTLSGDPGNSAALVPDHINGLPALYFDGTVGPSNWTGSVTPAHVFVITGYDGTSFGPAYCGLLTGSTAGDILVGNISSANWFNFSDGRTYRRYDVEFPESAAPGVFGTIGVVEVSRSSGWSLNGIQIGQQRSFTDRLWKGYWCEHLIYDRVLSDIERWKIYRYIACKYQIWPKILSGVSVFPFPSENTTQGELGRETYSSEPYDGDPTYLIRGNFKNGSQLDFGVRRQEEIDAAEAFYKLHHPSERFAVRDYRYYPYRDTIGRFTSSLRKSGSDVAYRFNYSFDFVEV